MMALRKIIPHERPHALNITYGARHDHRRSMQMYIYIYIYIYNIILYISRNYRVGFPPERGHEIFAGLTI